MNYRSYLENALNQGARSTKWDIILPNASGHKEQEFSVLAKDVNLPSLGVKTISVKFKGRDIPIAGQVTHPNEFSVTFMVDQEHEIRKYFEDWMLAFDARGYQTSIVDSTYESQLKSSARGLYRDIILMQYAFDADIGPYSNGDPVAKYTLYGCFPKNIGEFTYNNDNESLLDLRVTFSCVYYQRDDALGVS